MLERKLPRELKNSRVEGRIDLAEVSVVDIEIIRHREIRVVENVESLKA